MFQPSRRSAILAGLVLMSVIACGHEPDCSAPPPLTAFVFDAQQNTAIRNARVSGITGNCSQTEQGLTGCVLENRGAGTYSFDVCAEGYVCKHIDATVPETAATGACASNYTPQTINVYLESN